VKSEKVIILRLTAQDFWLLRTKKIHSVFNEQQPKNPCFLIFYEYFSKFFYGSG